MIPRKTRVVRPTMDCHVSLAGRASLPRKGNCLLEGRQPTLREPPQETWFLYMLVLKLVDVGLNFRRAPRADPQVPKVFEKLDGLIVITRALGGDECVYLGPHFRLAVSESGKILLTSRGRLALAPGALPRLAFRFLTAPLFTVPSRQCQQVRHRAWLRRRRARMAGALNRSPKATQQLRPDVRLTSLCQVYEQRSLLGVRQRRDPLLEILPQA